MSVRKRTWTTRKGTVESAWIVVYVDTTGRRRQKTFERKKEADAFSSTASVEVRQGTHVADSASVTVEKAGALWLVSRETAGLERATLAQYKTHLKHHIVPLIGSLLLSKVTVPVVRSFEDTLRKTRSLATTKKILTSLGSIFADANERGLATRNPVRDIRGARKGRDGRREKRQKGRLEVGVDIPTREEIKAFVAALKDEGWRPMLLTGVFSGMRSSEWRALRWKDVNFDKLEIHVTQRVDKYRAIGKPKSEAGFRTIPVPSIVINALKELKLKQGNKSGLVFPNPNGETRSHVNLTHKGIIPAMIRAGITVLATDKTGKQVLKAKYTGAHPLRHFFASWLINRKEDGGLGLPPKMVQERLGHSSIVVTMDTYGHLFPRLDDGTELAQAVNILLN